MIILYVYFVQNGTTAPNQEKYVKVSLKRSKQNIFNFFYKNYVILHMFM